MIGSWFGKKFRPLRLVLVLSRSVSFTLCKICKIRQVVFTTCLNWLLKTSLKKNLHRGPKRGKVTSRERCSLRGPKRGSNFRDYSIISGLGFGPRVSRLLHLVASTSSTPWCLLHAQLHNIRITVRSFMFKLLFIANATRSRSTFGGNMVESGHITNPRGFMDYKLNPRVDLGFVFMSMEATWTHVKFIFYEYTIGKGRVHE